MELHRSKARVGFRVMVVLSIGCSIAGAVRTVGQTGGDPAKARMQEMTRRELQLSNVVGDRGQPSDPKRSQAIMNQVSEDFQRILTLHNEIVRGLTSDETLSYQFISDATGEIRKRSARLQSSLKLQRPEPAADNVLPAATPEASETKDLLILLCKKIESFVKNPIIETPGTVDVQQLEKARRDLESVVELSSDLKRRADKQKQ
jgi:hypothetical protein